MFLLSLFPNCNHKNKKRGCLTFETAPFFFSNKLYQLSVIISLPVLPVQET